MIKESIYTIPLKNKSLLSILYYPTNGNVPEYFPNIFYVFPIFNNWHITTNNMLNKQSFSRK